MSWVNSVHRQFLPHGPSVLPFVGLSSLTLFALLLSSVVGTERRPLSSFAPEGYGSERVDRREDRDKLANLSLNHLLSVRLVCYSLRSSFGPFLASTSGPLVLRFLSLGSLPPALAVRFHLTTAPRGMTEERGNEPRERVM